MAANLFLTLLAQAMVAGALMLPIIFGVLFCGTYIVLIVVNTLFALVNGYRRQPQRLLLSIKAMVITSLVAATLLCVWSLFSIDGRFT